jgi:Late exocytosis, associated with Golgi transport
MRAVVPVNLTGNGLNGERLNPQSLAFSKFTIANLRSARDPANPTPDIYWLHCILAFVFVFYGLYLIHYHYEVRHSVMSSAARASTAL